MRIAVFLASDQPLPVSSVSNHRSLRAGSPLSLKTAFEEMWTARTTQTTWHGPRDWPDGGCRNSRLQPAAFGLGERL